ncbi:Atu4866 domain-containing protein [Micromonospora sp. FIMYZ51]|uniref:Atu4866 domain-containing protein n=1 Tax=Micromonospora sp. FIMYZ51 TaxID=3051832 RepID=UPI00311EE54D
MASSGAKRQSKKPYLGTMVSGACLVPLLGACTAEHDAARDGGQQSPPATALHIPTSPVPTDAGASHPYVGMWVTADGHIRQMLLPDGRYDEARGERESAYTGSYRVVGTRIEYVDDTGFSADGTFDGDVLRHAGYVFYREGSDAHREASAEPR